LLLLPGDAQAFFGWFKKHCACQQTNYASYYMTQPCATQTCQYVPQTAYRVNYVTVPVTTYRPVVGCGACGQQVVSMRPLIAYTRQAQVVPYQTYSLACSTCPTTPTVAAYPTQTVGYAATTSYAAPAAVPGCCGQGTSTIAPSASYAAPAYSGPTMGGTYSADPAATVAPSLSGSVAPSGTAVQGSSSYVPSYSPYTTYPSSTYPPASAYQQPAVIQQGATPPTSAPLETRRIETNGSQPAPAAPASPTSSGSSSSGDPAGLVPIPDRNTNGGSGSTGVNGLESSHERNAGPMIPDPESRSTERSPRNHWWAYSPVSLQSKQASSAASMTPAAQPKAANSDGWRPSKR
jgi:hypothetical protein